MTGDGEPRKIALFCPSVSKLVQWVAWDEQRLDLGSIARAFGLDPSTIKLNGHFISRGIDFVALSVTWRSLISFFSAKGLSAGKDDTDAVIVDGKLSRVGGKRAHDPQDDPGGILYREKADDSGECGSSQSDDCINMFKNKKLRHCSSGIGSKRRQFEDISSSKRLRICETSLGQSKDAATERGKVGVVATPLKCSFMNANCKRVREDEVCVSASCKRIR